MHLYRTPHRQLQYLDGVVEGIVGTLLQQSFYLSLGGYLLYQSEVLVLVSVFWLPAPQPRFTRRPSTPRERQRRGGGSEGEAGEEEGEEQQHGGGPSAVSWRDVEGGIYARRRGWFVHVLWRKSGGLGGAGGLPALLRSSMPSPIHRREVV